MRIGSLFSGAGGLDRAVEEVFGGEVVWFSEIDKAASKVLAHRFPGVPNLGDINQINWVNWKPMLEVDILCGGFPCTDVSAAGKRAGMHGTRSGLWSEFAKAIDILRPRMVVIENVRGLLSAHANRPMESDNVSLGDGGTVPVLRAAGAVLGDLADIGYDAAWTTFAAGDVGAPHRRERVFIVAYANQIGPEGCGLPDRMGATQPKLGSGESPLPEPESNGWHEGRPESARLVGGSDAPLGGDGHGYIGHRDRYGVPYASNAGIEPLLPTPCAQQSGNTPENHLLKKPGRKVVTDLAILVENGLIESGGALLPTPRSSDCFGAGLHGDGGMDLRTTVTLLPTPLATAGTDGPVTNCKSVQAICDGSAGRNPRLSEMAAGYLMPATAWGKYEPAIRRWESLTRPAPAPTEPNKNGNPRLSAAFSEWLMGWPAGWVTDPAIGISRNDQLRIVGNGVVSIQAAAAMRQLLAVAC